MTGDAKTLERARRLLLALIEEHEKVSLLVTELDRLLSTGHGIGDDLKRVEGTWGTLWRTVYGADYVWNYKRDRPPLKRLLSVFPPEALETRFALYLQDRDPFLAREKHPFSLFMLRVNRYQDTTLDAFAPPADCSHEPPCASDVEHTRRRAMELRS